jgi:hypothetical protein
MVIQVVVRFMTVLHGEIAPGWDVDSAVNTKSINAVANFATFDRGGTRNRRPESRSIKVPDKRPLAKRMCGF